MARYFFTADPHYYHFNSIEYCNRPFKNVEHMNDMLLYNTNQRVKEDDILVVVGDIGFLNSKRYKEIIDKINCQVWLVQGNHCIQNKIKGFQKATLNLSNFNVLLQHIPPYDIFDIPTGIDFVLSGHVHNTWKHKIIDGIPIINVGVDVWNYYPISVNDILKYYHQIKNTD